MIKRKPPRQAIGEELQTIKATSIYFPSRLHLRLRTHALHEGRSMNQVIITAVTDYLKKGEKA